MKVIIRTRENNTINAHYFIPEKYWVDNERIVRERYLPIAKTFIYEEDSVVKGFISIMEAFLLEHYLLVKSIRSKG